MRLKKSGSLRGLTIALLICGLNFELISENEVEMSRKLSRCT